MRVCIVGGGPSGMMAAISAKKHYPEAEIVLFERNNVLGKKMRLTGGGRCNVTANVDDKIIIQNTPKNGKFLYSALANLAVIEIIAFFNERNCPLKEEDHHRMFPMSNQSADIVETLRKELVKSGVVINYDSFITDIDYEYKNMTVNEAKLSFDHLILATGGRTLPKTGSDGNGYELAKKAGHGITPLLAAEVPLISNDAFIQDKSLQGLSFKDVLLTVYDGKKVVRRIQHDLLITHFGLSGPAALRASFDVQRLIAKGPVTLSIDFMPECSELDENHVNFQKRFVDYVKERDGDLLFNVKNFKMTVYETRGFSYAFVTNGGVDVREVDPKTMRSKLNPCVSICGELLDVSSYTGGYNITSALVTGYTAGMNCLNLEG